MKKSFLILGLFIAILGTINSCKKVTPTAMEIDKSKTATITGYVHAHLSLVTWQNDNVWENAPAGTKMFISVANNQYVNGAEGYSIYETTVGSDGKYSFNVPADINGVDVEVSLVDFEYNQEQAQWDPVESEWVLDGTERKIYTVSSWNPNLTVGSVKIKDFYYSAN